MNVFRDFQYEIIKVIEDLEQEDLLPRGLDTARVACEPPREAAYGDVTTNVAMILARPAGKNPRELAALLAERLGAHHAVEKAIVAGPGFINLTLARTFWHGRLRDILEAGTAYGNSALGAGRRINVEYVSANPTGPMHAGHVRGAVIGDTLANLLEKAGYDVTREYYFNDAGAQVDTLARSAYVRYREALGEKIGAIPEGLYPGDYLMEVGHALAKRDGEKWLGKPEATWLAPIRDFAVQAMMDMIKEDLALIGIKHDVFSNEREIVENGTLETVFKTLQEMDLIYQGTLPPPKGKEMEDWEPAELTLFRSSKFGDSSDRPLKKRDGTWAYIMPDIAYHYDKMRRGFNWMINVLGKDHGNYLDKMRPAVAALSGGEARLDVIFCGIVKVLKNGEPVKLSKRSGSIITLREMVEEVGADATRFFMLFRTADAELEFDFAKVVEQTRDNPVFYVQYAHARACSVFRNAATDMPNIATDDSSLLNVSLDSLTAVEEIDLIRLMAGWPRIVEGAAEAHEPHRIAYYLQELAAAFHGLWNKGNADSDARFLVADEATAAARLALVRGLQLVIASGLQVLGVKPVEEMH